MQNGNKRGISSAPGQYFVGLGANLPSRHGTPLETLAAAIDTLESRNIRVLARSPWFESEPVPKSDQAWFINAVICIVTLESAFNVLKYLHEIEMDFGRVRSVPNAARPLDLDLLASVEERGPLVPVPEDASGSAFDLSGRALMLPHPRMTERAFVLRPLAAIAPDWIHPNSGKSAAAMAAALPQEPVVRVMRRSSRSAATR